MALVIGGRLRWAMVAAYAAAIFIQSALPPALRVVSLNGADKLLHAGAYALLAVLICRALEVYPLAGRPVIQIAAVGVLISALYGITDECHQAFVPHRDADVWDWIADLCGSVAGSAFWVCVRPK
jgi:VanZ family protein